MARVGQQRQRPAKKPHAASINDKRGIQADPQCAKADVGL